VTHPYKRLPDSRFWSRSVARVPAEELDPVSDPPFRLYASDRIATAGSCFAQHIARTLRSSGYSFLETERGPEERGFGLYSARFGNVYTARQLLQLFQRAYGLFAPADIAWRTPEGRFVDPFRPQVEPGGYASPEAVVDDRDRHLEAVRSMFELCDAFVFTLGLTEAWRSRRDGAVFPLAPGVAGSPENPDAYEFHNFSARETVDDLARFIRCLRTVNAKVKLVLTVSPVPLAATYEDRHVLVSTVYSKSVLRVAAEEACRTTELAAYYPSYEIITGHHTGYRYFADDLRSVTKQGVARAMALFSRHFLSAGEAPAQDGDENRVARQPSSAGLPNPPAAAPETGNDRGGHDELYDIVCDEEALDK